MFEYERVGRLAGAGPGHDLLLPKQRPLSYLRVGQQPEDARGLTRALLEHQATEFRVRVPVVAEPGTGPERISEALRRFAVSRVFPVLAGSCSQNGEVEVCWLDLVQVAALRRLEGTGLAERNVPVTAAGIRLSPTYEVSPSAETANQNWEYWNSRWEFADPPDERESWWRVRPNKTRRREHPLLLTSRGAEARGTFTVCLHRRMKEKLGNPSHLIVEHPFRGARIPVLVLSDEFRGMDERVWGDTVFLDRTARDALGLLDGEFCVVHPWLHPRGALWRRQLRDRLVGARTIVAHARAPARADLEKPVCRLEPEALETIGGRSGEFVRIERVIRPNNALPGHWEVVRTSRRVLPIDAAERDRRANWEAPQSWDERSQHPSQGGDGVPELTGYVDCTERLGLYPPYPAIYLNYYTRQEALAGLELCQPVEVRLGLSHRVATDASEFAWLAVIALIGAAIAFVDSSFWQAFLAIGLFLLIGVLLVFRAIRAMR